MSIGVLHRTFLHRSRYHLAVTALGFFDFDEPDRLLPEPAMWPLVIERLGAQAILDQGMPKVGAEVLVLGKAMAPRGTPVRALEIGLRMGGIDKRLTVIGDRHWVETAIGYRPSEPQPFTACDIGW